MTLNQRYFVVVVVAILALRIFQQTHASYIPHKACEVHYKPGDVILGALYPVYYTDEYPCDGPLWVQLISMVETLTYAVEIINQRDDILKNITVGYYVRNNCGEEDVTTWTILTMLGPGGGEDFARVCPVAEYDRGNFSSEQIVGVVGTARSSTSFLAAKTAAIYDTPIISYWATSDEFSNSQRFPYFLRTVAPDKFQVGAIMDVLLHYNWKYIALFYSVDSYGVHGARQIQTQAEDLDICIAVNLPVSNYPSDNELRDIANKLIENDKVSVIVIFSLWRPAYGVLQAVLEHDMPQTYTFIASDGWGGDLILEMQEEPFSSLQHGSIFVRQYPPPNHDLRAYLKQLPDNQHLASQWYRDVLLEIKETHGCDDDDWSDCPIPEAVNEMTIINSVNAFAYALQASIDAECPNGNNSDASTPICEEALDGVTYLKHLLDVSFDDGIGGTFEFDENGDTSGEYLYQSWQPGVDGVYQMVDVGNWDPTNAVNKLHIDEDKQDWNSLTGDIPKSLCVEECGPGTIAVPLKKKCCWGCEPCADHAIVVNASSCMACSVLEWPDDDTRTQCIMIRPDYITLSDPIIMTIVIVSALGLFLCGLATVGILLKRNHPLIKATSRELSCVNLFGLATACVASLLTILRPSAISCTVSEICISLCFSLMFAPILLKVNRIWRIFQQGSKSVKRPRFVGPKQQLILTAVVISIQVSM